MSDKAKVLQILNEAPDGWVCSNYFRNQYLPEFRARFNDLRKDGFVIIARKCLKHKHKGAMNEYKLISKLEQGGVVPRQHIAVKSVADPIFVKNWLSQWKPKQTKETIKTLF